MPYASVAELPQAVRENYQPKCQRAFMHAFNSDYARNKNENRAFAVGNAAAQQCEKANKKD